MPPPAAEGLFCTYCGKRIGVLLECPFCGAENEFAAYPEPPAFRTNGRGPPAGAAPRPTAARGAPPSSEEPAAPTAPGATEDGSTEKLRDEPASAPETTETWSPGAHEVPALGVLVCQEGAGERQLFQLPPGEFLVGREGDLPLRSTRVSSKHAVLRVREKGPDGTPEITVEDLGSKNGTYVNEDRIPARVPVRLHDFDRVGFADVKYVFRARAAGLENDAKDAGDTEAGATEALTDGDL